MNTTVKKVASQGISMSSWGDGFNVMKNGGVIPCGDYFLVLTPKNGYILSELYISLDEVFTKFTPVEKPQKKKEKKKEPVKTQLKTKVKGEVDLFG